MIILAAVLLLTRGQRKCGAAVACGLVLDLVSCNLLLKPLIGRARPFAVNTAVELPMKAPLDASFPSGHTAASFAAVFALKTAVKILCKPPCASRRIFSPFAVWRKSVKPRGNSLCIYIDAKTGKMQQHFG